MSAQQTHLRVVDAEERIEVNRWHLDATVRTVMGLTFEQADRACGFPKGTIRSWHTGQAQPAPGEVHVLADAADMPVTWLFEPPLTGPELEAARRRVLADRARGRSNVVNLYGQPELF